MHTTDLKLVTIVAEPVLESHLTDLACALGATGFTVVEGRGQGSRGMRASEVPGTHVRIEVVVTATVADAIVAHVARDYFPHYAVIAFVADVCVVRGEKYVR